MAGSFPSWPQRRRRRHNKKEISWRKIPKTFQDAITTTRWLGLRYLWIDSLCTLQDNVADWEVQSADMARVYQGSEVVISATSAPNSKSGFLFVKELAREINDDDDDRNWQAEQPGSLLYFGRSATADWSLQIAGHRLCESYNRQANGVSDSRAWLVLSGEAAEYSCVTFHVHRDRFRMSKKLHLLVLSRAFVVLGRSSQTWLLWWRASRYRDTQRHMCLLCNITGDRSQWRQKDWRIYSAWVPVIHVGNSIKLHC